MTHAFLEDFAQRKRQVMHYLAVVSQAERELEQQSENRRTIEERLLVLRAGTFLLLYNLIEATTRGAVEAIHDKVTTSGVGFESLTLCLRKEVVRLFKREADPASHHTVTDFPSAFVAIAMEQGFKLSGSVDARAIRRLGECYGFSCDTEKATTRDGSDLLTIKTHRNDLAHGLKTFEEVGRDQSAKDLLLITRRSTRYMEQILKNIASYLDEENYLDSAVA